MFRPPYGYYNNRLIEVCEELNLYCIEWSVDSLDWKGLSASELAGRVISKSKKGLVNANNSILSGIPIDMISINIKTAIQSLGEILGESVSEDVLNKIFERFCVGK